MRDPFHILKQTVRDNVRSLMAEMKLSQRKAAGSGLSQKTISNVVNLGEENGEQGINLRTLHDLSETLDLPSYQLLINNLPADGHKRKQLDQLVRSFVGASERQQKWLIETCEIMRQLPPDEQK